MKYFFIIFLFFTNQLYSQKYDYTWIVGYNLKPSDPSYSSTNIDFNIKPLNIFTVKREMHMSVYNSSISDEDGNLQFYTNGCFIANGFNEKIENGDTLNPGKTFTNYCKYDYPAGQSSFIIPSIKEKGSYYLLHKNAQLYPTEPYLLSDRVYVTKVDMNKNAKKGKVIYKNRIIMADSLGAWDFTGTKHANGKDWWIMTPRYHSNKYYTFLFSDGIIKDTLKQTIGVKDYSDGCASAFSPDGTKYARFEPAIDNQLFLMDFDRTTGKLSNFKYIDVSNLFTNAGCGVSFSPNSRYIYVSLSQYIYQFDTQATDVEKSKILVAEYDGFKAPFATSFDACQLGPDCRIYINSTNDVRYYHYIDKPDVGGVGCNVVQHGLKLPTGHGMSLPYFPNYRLGTIINPGYPCDSTLKETTSVGFANFFVPTLEISPNPSKGVFRLRLPETWQGEQIYMYNISGQLVYEEKLNSNEQHYYINTPLAAGLYLLKVRFKDGRTATEKILIE